jgi:hypothetical protein
MLIAHRKLPSGAVFTVTAAPGAAKPGETELQTIERVAALGGGAVTIVDSATLTPSPAQLLGYARRKQLAIATGSLQVNVGTAAAPLTVEASMDAQSLAWLNYAAAQAAGNAGALFAWVGPAGETALTAPQVLTIYSAVAGFIQATFVTLGQVIAAINAGTIATTAQIDTPAAPIPAWPANS